MDESPSAARDPLREGHPWLRKIVAGAVISAIVLIFVYLLLEPAVRAARDTANLGYAYGKMKDLVVSLYRYHDQHDTLPMAGGGTAPGSQLSWRVRILPMLGEEALYSQFRLDEPWDSEHNRALIPKMPEVFKCRGGNFPAGETPYLAVTGPGTAFDDPENGRSLSELTDGDSKTILLVEADRAVEWTKPEDWQFDPGDPRRGLGTLRESGFLAGFADGRIDFIDTEAWAEKVSSMMTRAGGER